MSYFDDASLVMIPSGYKTSKVYSVKPTDGSGDLTFSRSNDTATRVNSAGLIEKVRTNLILQSNTFSTTWAGSGSSVTSGQSGYDGTSNAWLLTRTGASGFLSQNLVQSTLGVVSVYAKANANSWFRIRVSPAASSSAFYNLSNGTLGTVTSGQTATITSIGNGWYRCTLTYPPTSSDVRLYVADADGDISGSSGSVFIQSAQWELGDIATDYIPTTTAAVSVGPVANVPRLDYLNSSCPRLLLEPQRTNLVTYSEQLNTGSGGTSAVTANTAVSPDGYTNADTIGAGYWTKSTSQAAGTYTLSVFAKYQSTASILLYIYDGAYYQGSFNLQTGVATTSTGSPTVSMVSYGNGWYRCIVTATTASTISEVGFGSGNFYGYGLQLEAGAYATSYIPTLGSASTRGRDDCAKTGISSLIGQTAGTVFVEFEFSGSKDTFWPVMTVMGATSAELIEIYGSGGSNGVGVFMLDNGVTQFSQSRTISVGRHKLAIAYELNNTVAYLDGTIMGTVDTSCTIPTMTQIGIGEFAYSSAYTFGDRIDQAILFPVRLSNSDLAALTA